jgi:hypothetical protein
MCNHAIACGQEPYTISMCFTLNIKITIKVFASVIAALDYQSLDSKQTWVYLYMNQKTGPKNDKNLWSPLVTFDPVFNSSLILVVKVS